MRAGLVLALAMAPAVATAQGMDVAGTGARAIGRAGSGVVTADDAAALYYNPAGLARRSDLRAQIGLAFADRAASYESGLAFPSTPTRVFDRAGAELVPWGGIELGLGDYIVVGAGFLAPTAVSYASATPAGEPDAGEDLQFPARYAASRFRLLRRGVGLGVAVRPLPWLAVGASALAFEVSLQESRTLFGGTDANADDDFRDPHFDMPFTARTRDRFVPAASFGVIAAPEEVPLELGVSVFWSDDAHLAGDVEVGPSRGEITDLTDKPPNDEAVLTDPRATVTFPFPLVVRAGVRWVGERLSLEADGELGRLTGGDDLAWQVTGVRLQHRDAVTGNIDLDQPLAEVALGARLRTGYTLRGVVEYTIASGFLTLTGGYAYGRGIVPKSALSTAFPDLDSHTFALGLEARVEGATITAGVARSELAGETVQTPGSGTYMVAPFRQTQAAVGGGSYDGAATVVGVGVEVDFR